MALLKINMRWNNEMTDLGLCRVLSSAVNQQFLYVPILDNEIKILHHEIKLSNKKTYGQLMSLLCLWNSKFSVGAIENFHLAVVRIENSSTFQMLWDGGTPFWKTQVNVLLSETMLSLHSSQCQKKPNAGKVILELYIFTSFIMLLSPWVSGPHFSPVSTHF